jgi:hypothetical protein
VSSATTRRQAGRYFRTLYQGQGPWRAASKSYNGLGIQVTLRRYLQSSLQGSTPLISKPAIGHDPETVLCTTHAWNYPYVVRYAFVTLFLIKFKDIYTSVYLLSFFSLFFSFPKWPFGINGRMTLIWILKEIMCMRCVLIIEPFKMLLI